MTSSATQPKSSPCGASHATIGKALLQIMHKQHEEDVAAGVSAVEVSSEGVDESLRESLRALGYL